MTLTEFTRLECFWCTGRYDCMAGRSQMTISCQDFFQIPRCQKKWSCPVRGSAVDFILTIHRDLAGRIDPAVARREKDLGEQSARSSRRLATAV